MMVNDGNANKQLVPLMHIRLRLVILLVISVLSHSVLNHIAMCVDINCSNVLNEWTMRIDGHGKLFDISNIHSL